MPQDFRTKKTYDRYMKKVANGLLNHGCRLCQIEPIKDFKYWKILDNEYPWDLVAKINHILIPKRHVIYSKLNNAEKKEFDKIKLDYIEKKYIMMVEVTDRQKSIPSHFHVHLLVLKKKLPIK